MSLVQNGVFRFFAVCAAVVVFITLSACASPETSVLELIPCDDLAVDGLLCGRVVVPENRGLADGRKLELSVAVAPAIEPRSGRAPLFFLEGGPGAAPSKDAAFYMGEGAAYRQDRDVVLADLRGTGRSGALRCPALEEPTLEQQLMEMYPAGQVETCRRQLEQSADLTQYTTDQAVEDLEAVRAALGHDEIILHGTSYGTRVAQEYLRRYPQHVRSFVGIGSLAAEHKMPLRHAGGFQRAFDMLLTDCERDEACHSAFPDLRTQWVELLATLEESPAVFRYESKTSGEVEVVIKRGVFVSKLRSSLYFASGGRQLPRIIDAAARGDFAPFVAMIEPSEPVEESSGIAEGHYLSVTCAEDVPLITAEEVDQWTRGTYLGSYRVDQQRRACEHWTAASPIPLAEPRVSSVPALLVTGDRDPVTPASDAEAVAQLLSNGRVLVVPHAGHLPWDGSDPLCVDGIVLQFLESHEPDGLDVSCLDALEPLPFVLGAEAGQTTG